MIKSEEKLLSQRRHLLEQIRQVGPPDFESLALKIFHFQANNNLIYNQFIDLLGLDAKHVESFSEIPFLPVSAFKHHAVQTGSWEPVLEFSSSGTTGMQSSRHLLREEDWYIQHARNCFSQFYGSVGEYCFLALLPSYLERSGSSLVYMARDFIGQSRYSQSGFFLRDTRTLRDTLYTCREEGIPTILLGVSFALWDFAEEAPIDFPELIVMETGGMKGRREEITREELHGILKAGFGVKTIHSEYGMTELLSQAYSKGGGLFYPPPAMRVLSRDIYDPLDPQLSRQTGTIQVVDLANLDSVSFIATEDLGKVFRDGSFQVLGRMDNSDLRGCNLMV